MNQRRSVIVSAILFAIVLVGSFLFLVFTEPNQSIGDLPEATATPEATPEENNEMAMIGATPTPETSTLVVLEQVAEPTPEPTPSKTPRIASATITAPTGPETPLLATGTIMLLLGATSLRLVTRAS